MVSVGLYLLIGKGVICNEGQIEVTTQNGFEIQHIMMDLVILLENGMGEKIGYRFCQGSTSHMNRDRQRNVS